MHAYAEKLIQQNENRNRVTIFIAIGISGQTQLNNKSSKRVEKNVHDEIKNENVQSIRISTYMYIYCHVFVITDEYLI